MNLFKLFSFVLFLVIATSGYSQEWTKVSKEIKINGCDVLLSIEREQYSLLDYRYNTYTSRAYSIWEQGLDPDSFLFSMNNSPFDLTFLYEKVEIHNDSIEIELLINLNGEEMSLKTKDKMFDHAELIGSLYGHNSIEITKKQIGTNDWWYGTGTFCKKRGLVSQGKLN